MVINEETKQYIAAHRHDDVRQLALKGCKESNVDHAFALQQISAYQQIKDKLPTLAARTDVIFPVRLSLEQCSSEETARLKGELIKGTHLADLTGGFGIDCLALSKQFKRVSYVERNEELCKIAEHNFPLLSTTPIDIHHEDGIAFLRQHPEIDTVFLDPARRTHQGGKAVLINDCEPDISQEIELLTQNGRETWVKLSPMLDLSSALHSLPVNEAYIISVKNECKELLLHLKKGVKEPVITAIDISGSGERQLFSFRPSEEAAATAEIAPSIENYLYEPNAAVMKAGAFKGVGMRYGLKKLDTHSHLYTSAHMEESFCGRVFAVREQWEFNKHNLQAIRTHYVAAHVSTRNFPLGSDALRQRLKIKEGGHAYLFGTTVNRSLYIIACDRIR